MLLVRACFYFALGEGVSMDAAFQQIGQLVFIGCAIYGVLGIFVVVSAFMQMGKIPKKGRKDDF